MLTIWFHFLKSPSSLLFTQPHCKQCPRSRAWPWTLNKSELFPGSQSCARSRFLAGNLLSTHFERTPVWTEAPRPACDFPASSWPPSKGQGTPWCQFCPWQTELPGVGATASSSLIPPETVPSVVLLAWTKSSRHCPSPASFLKWECWLLGLDLYVLFKSLLVRYVQTQAVPEKREPLQRGSQDGTCTPLSLAYSILPPNHRLWSRGLRGLTEEQGGRAEQWDSSKWQPYSTEV